MFARVESAVPTDLDTMAPGAELGAVLASLDYDRLSPHDLVTVLRAQRRQASHYQAASYWTMDRIVGAYEDPESERDDTMQALEGASVEIGAALRLTRRAAEFETELAHQLARRVPVVLDAFLFGRIDLRRARILVDGTLHVHETTARRVVDAVIDEAPQLTTGQLSERVRKLCFEENPSDAQDRYEWSVDDRRVVLEANPSGTANLLGLDLPPHVAKGIKRRLHRLAMKLRREGDVRPIDQIRADLFCDTLRGRTSSPQLEPEEIIRDEGKTVVDIGVTLDMLAGLKATAGDLRGFGPVLADIARQITEHNRDAEWRWTLIDPDTRQPIDGGITRRRPTVAQRRRAQTLNTTCLHPGCRAPAVDCDIDHGTPWAERSITCSDDLRPLCRYHHRIRHAFGWAYEIMHGGDNLATSPLRHDYTTSGRPP